MLHFSEADVAELLTMPAAIDAIEAAFRRRAAGQIDNSPRRRVRLPGLVLHALTAADAELGLAAFKNYTTTRAGAHFHVGVYDSDGRWIALLDADLLGRLRTGATTAVATKYLAAADADTAAIVGAGAQAVTQLEALAAVRSLRRVRVFCRSAERRAAFARQMSQRLAIAVEPAESARAAAAGAAIVVTVTPSREPVLADADLAPGALVCAVGCNWLDRSELEPATVGRARWVVCDDIAACQAEAGELALAAAAGVFRWEQAVNLAEVVAGIARPPAADERPLVFKSVGLALEDLAVAAVVLREAPRRAASRRDAD